MIKGLNLILSEHIKNEVLKVNISRFSQESAYVNAILTRLDGFIYKGPLGEIEIRSTVVNDRGPKCAENKYGADFAITVILKSKNSSVRKSILGQAKKGSINDLPKSGKEFLNKQIKKMADVTDSYVVLEAPITKGNPKIIYSDIKNKCLLETNMDIEDYIVNKLIACKHGDNRSEFVDAVQESSLSKLSILMRI